MGKVFLQFKKPELQKNTSKNYKNSSYIVTFVMNN